MYLCGILILQELSMIPFVLIVLCIYFGINSYLFVRGWQVFSNAPTLRIIYCILFGCLCLSFVLGKVLEHSLPFNAIFVLQWIGYLWFAAMIYLLLFVLAVDLVRSINHFLPFLPDFVIKYYTALKYILLSAAAVTVGIALFVGYSNFKEPQIAHLSLHIKKETPNVKQLRIAMVSDIHLGHLIQIKELSKFVSLINEQKPDIVLIAGDIIDGDTRALQTTEIGKEFHQITAPLGIYAVKGNHDLMENDETYNQLIAHTPIRLLQDDFALIDSSFYVVGRKDRRQNDRLAVEDLTQNLDKKLPVILLDHQPYDLQNAVNAGIDLQLSGHTHDGQFFPINLIVRKMYELSYGYMQKGNTHFYVSSGIGLWGPPIRLGTVSEICVIDVVFD